MNTQKQPIIYKQQTLKWKVVFIKCFSPWQRDEEKKKLITKWKKNTEINSCPIYTNEIWEQVRALSYNEK
jgi:hypothetical protein